MCRLQCPHRFRTVHSIVDRDRDVADEDPKLGKKVSLALDVGWRGSYVGDGTRPVGHGQLVGGIPV